MKVSFDLSLNKDEQQNIMFYLEEERVRFIKFFRDNSLKMDENPFDYTIVIKEKIFDFISDGMVDYKNKRVIFYGIEDIEIVSHEWTHIALSNPNCQRHSEGLAIYIQMQLGKFHFHGFETPLELVKAYMHSSNREKVKNWLDFIKEPQNFFDSRLGRMLISRALSAQFVTFLIEKYGIEKYLNKFFYKIREDKSELWLEDVEFTNFKDSFKSDTEWVMEPFLELKQSFIEKFSKHFLPKSGSVLNYLIVNRDKIDPQEFTYLQNVALEDLRTTLFFYD